jgi:hypothetical protein
MRGGRTRYQAFFGSGSALFAFARCGPALYLDTQTSKQLIYRARRWNETLRTCANCESNSIFCEARRTEGQNYWPTANKSVRLGCVCVWFL